MYQMISLTTSTIYIGHKLFALLKIDTMQKINITCQTCSITHEVNRTQEIPKTAISMWCNWCPDCEDKAEDYYEEGYNKSDGKEPPKQIPDNQLCMPFELMEIEESIIEPKERVH